MGRQRTNFVFAVSAVLLLIAAVCCGCTDAGWDHTFNYGGEHKITLYSGGKAVGVWTSTGRILNEDNTDGYIFRCKETDEFTIVNGDVVIERI